MADIKPTPTPSPTAKQPTPQGISALLKRAGFERSNHGRPGVMWNEVSTGFVCWKTYHRDYPDQHYVAIQHDVEGMHSDRSDEGWHAYRREALSMLERYAGVIREHGYHALVRTQGHDELPQLAILTVVTTGKG